MLARPLPRRRGRAALRPGVELLARGAPRGPASSPARSPPQRLADAVAARCRSSRRCGRAAGADGDDGPGRARAPARGRRRRAGRAGASPARRSSTTCTPPTRRRWTCSPTSGGGCAAGRCCCCSPGAARACRPGTGCAAGTELTRAATVVTLGAPRRAAGGRAGALGAARLEPELERRVYAGERGTAAVRRRVPARRWRRAARRAGRELRDLLGARVAGLGATARQLLETAAVIGRSFSFETVRAASGRGDEEATDGLDELVGARPRARARRRRAGLRLHARQAARARLRADRPRAPPAAAPARRRGAACGPGDGTPRPRRSTCAWPATTRARPSSTGSRPSMPRRCSRTADALDHLDAALALGVPDAAGLHERIGDLRTLVGDYAGALSSYETRGRRVRARRAGAASSTSSAASTSGAASGSAPQARFALALEALGPAGRRAAGADPGRPQPDAHQAGSRSGRRRSPPRPARWRRRRPTSARSAQAHNVLGDARPRRRRARRGARGARAQPRDRGGARRHVGAHGRAQQPRAGRARRRRARPRARAHRGGAGAVRRARATATARRRSRTTSPTCTTPPAATTSRWRTSSGRSRSSPRSAATSATRLPEIWKLVSW